jgi:hypothetical protein
LAKIDWFGNYTIHKITNKDLQYIGNAKNIEDFINRFVEIVKDNVLKKVSNINSIKWNIRSFDETNGFHLFMKEVGKILEKIIKLELTKKHPYYAYEINKHNINFDKTIVVEIIDNDKIIFIVNISVEQII